MKGARKCKDKKKERRQEHVVRVRETIEPTWITIINVIEKETSDTNAQEAREGERER